MTNICQQCLVIVTQTSVTASQSAAALLPAPLLAMTQAPADLQNFLQQLQRSGQASPSAPAAEAQGGQPSANQWAYLAFLMQQQQQQQQQQQRAAPQDFASLLASLASDPATAGQQLAPLLTAMMQKAAGDADGKGGARQGGEGNGEAAGAFSASAEGGATSSGGKVEGMLDASALLPLLQLQCVASRGRTGWPGHCAELEGGVLACSRTCTSGLMLVSGRSRAMQNLKHSRRAAATRFVHGLAKGWPRTLVIARCDGPATKGRPGSVRPARSRVLPQDAGGMRSGPRASRDSAAPASQTLANALRRFVGCLCKARTGLLLGRGHALEGRMDTDNARLRSS